MYLRKLTVAFSLLDQLEAILRVSIHQDCEIRQLEAEYQSFMFLDVAPLEIKKYLSSVDNSSASLSINQE